MNFEVTKPLHMKKYLLFLSIAALVGFSSCASLRIDKRHHNKGWYVDFGNNQKPQATAKHTESEEKTVPVEVAPAEQQSATPVSPALSDCNNCEQNPTAVAPEEVITIAPANDEVQSVSNSKGEQMQTPVAKHAKRNSEPSSGASDDRLILLVILAILIPPLAVYLKEGVTSMFWITLICWIIGGTFLFGGFGYGYIGGLGLLAVVLALLVVFDVL